MRKLLTILLLLPILSFAQGTANRPLERFPKGSISLLSSGATLLGTTENGTENFYPMLYAVAIQSSNFSVLATPAVISIGTNSPNYNNILSGVTLTGSYLVNQVISSSIGGTVYSAVAPNTGIYVKVTPLIGTGTAVAAHVTLLGDYHN